MKFYNRKNEIVRLRQWSEQAAKGPALLTLMVGRRRVGKTALLTQTFGNEQYPSLYLFISRKQEALLCDDCLLYTSPSPRDRQKSRMPSSA